MIRVEQAEIQDRKNKPDKAELLRYGVFCGAFFVIAFFTVLFSYLRMGEHKFNAVHIWTSVALTALVAVYQFFNIKTKSFKTEQYILSGLAVLASGVLYLIFGPATLFPVWILGTVIISCFVDLSIGILTGYFFLLQEYHYYGSGLYGLIVLFVVITLIGIASFFAGKNLPESVGEKLEGLFMFGRNKEDKNINSERNLAYLESFATELNVKGVNDYDLNKAVFVSEKTPQEKLSELVEKEVFAEEIKETGTVVKAEEPKVYDYGKYAVENSALLETLKEVKKSAYVHSVKVAAIAGNCSRHLGLNVVFTRAVSLYHEIGKSMEGDPVANSREILTKNDFPETLINAVDEVTNKKNLPFTSREAFVVAVSDTIITTYIYLKKTSPSISNLKIIDSAMTKYMLNGRGDNSGITVKDCGDIKNFFLELLEEWENSAK